MSSIVQFIFYYLIIQLIGGTVLELDSSNLLLALKKNVGKTILGSSRLTNKDVLICNGGANNVYNSNSKKVILQIMKFFQDMINQT
jgi:hypothetical protein